jgi:hypothetical protein
MPAELTGAGTGERVGGAGALPGPVNETGVAVVRDERVGERTLTIAGRISTARHGSLGGAAAAAAYVLHGTNQVRETIGKSSVHLYPHAHTHLPRSPRLECDHHGRCPARHDEPADVGDGGHPRWRVDRWRRRGPGLG